MELDGHLRLNHRAVGRAEVAEPRSNTTKLHLRLCVVVGEQVCQTHVVSTAQKKTEKKKKKKKERERYGAGGIMCFESATTHRRATEHKFLVLIAELCLGSLAERCCKLWADNHMR